MEDFMFIPGKKSVYYAKKYLNIGNINLSKKKYFEALENFNKSLCYAEENSEQSKLALEGRLEIYKTIDMKVDPWKFFQLSYPANRKVPFIVDCLDVKNDENFGRYVITNKALRAGDIIAIEEPFFKFLDPSIRHLRCANCLKSNKLCLVPSNLCSSSMFCSESCKNFANEVFYQHEIDFRVMEFTQRILLESLKILDFSFDKLIDLMENPEMSSKTAFDFDWSDAENNKNNFHSLLSFNALQVGPEIGLDYVDSHPIFDIFKTDREKEIAKNFMRRIARILSVNCYSLDWLMPDSFNNDNHFLTSSNKMKIGSGLFIFGSLFNHSCAPNIDRILVDNKFVFFVRRPINKGEQLFISYGPSFSKQPNESRQNCLKNSFHFECSCEACAENYPIEFNTSPINAAKISMENDENSWISELKQNFESIEKKFQKFPNRSISNLMDRNLYLLAAIAKNEPFIF